MVFLLNLGMISPTGQKMLENLKIKTITKFSSGVLLGLGLISSPMMSTAWSHQNHLILLGQDARVSREAPVPLAPLNTPSIAAEACTSLLTYNHTPSTFSANRSQRTAGKLAALSMVFGARFALEPTEHQTQDVEYKNKFLRHILKTKPPQHSAQMIAQFRQCQKEYILSTSRQ